MSSAQLRAFAFLHQVGRSEISVHRDLSTVLSVWSDASQENSSTAMLLHVGFERPETDAAAALLEDWAGHVLLTESARWCLPAQFECSSTPITSVTLTGHRDQIPIYLGSKGWGYILDTEERKPVPQILNEPWLLALRDELKPQYEVLHSSGITTDQQYIEKRNQLPVTLRDEIDDFRFAHLLRSVDQADAFALLKIAPDWLLHLPVSAFDELPLRARNAFRRAGIEVLGELQRLTPEDVLSIENFGRKTYEALAPAMIAIAGRKPHQHLIYSRDSNFSGGNDDPKMALIPSGSELFSKPLEEVRYRTLWAGVQLALNQLAPRDRMVLEARLGREEPPKTLEVLGEMLGVSRERARQIETKGLQEFTEKSWGAELTRRVGARFAGRREPLYLDLLSAEDDWFEGFDACIPFLGQLIERLHEGVYWAWPLNGRIILARVRAADWEALERSTRSALATQAGAGLNQSDVRLFIESAASAAGCPELLSPLTQAIWNDLHFARDSEIADEVLVGVGRSIRAVLAAIMAESTESMDLRTISVLCAERIGQIPSDMAIRSALNSIGAHPFSGRRYGLERHLGLTDAEIENVLANAEQVLATGPAGKQWHCTEILAALRDERSDLEHLDQYALNVVLHRSHQLKYLGRFVWVSLTSGASSTKDRLDIADLTKGILERAGRPLSTAELKSAISNMRGLNMSFQVFPNDTIARVDAGLWGLVHRDFHLTTPERNEVLRRLYEVLESRSKALHVTEVRQALAEQGLVLPERVTNDMIFGLSQTDRRFRMGAGQLVGLAHWSSLNRFSARGAIRQAVSEQGSNISPFALQQRVDELAERRVERSVVHAELRSLGYVYDEQMNHWVARRDEAGELFE